MNLTNATLEEADALSKKIADAEALRVEAEKKRESAELTRNKQVADAISNINKAQAKVLMRSIENYAYECFNVTASHKQAVSELTTIEEVIAYDYRTSYPKMLEMSV